MRLTVVGIAIITTVVLLWFGGRWIMGFARVDATVPAPPLPASGFPHGRLTRVLGDYVIDGRVDYGALAAQRQQLEQYVALLANSGPNTTPARFPDEHARMAFYMNAYNALVLHAVISHWPIESVHDVHGPVVGRRGFGFFYGLSFNLDGGTTNLYNLENGVIRGFGDARIHAAINCASTSCPALRAAPFDPAKLDTQLDDAMRVFVNDPNHVSLSDTGVRLNPIFKWYREDFESHALPWGGTLLDFVQHFTEGNLAVSLRRARNSGAEIVFMDYDWSINGAHVVVDD